jgi:hypothetical protein
MVVPTPNKGNLKLRKKISQKKEGKIIWPTQTNN